MKRESASPPANTIAAISTPPGRGAIAVVRVSGPTAASVAAALGINKPRPRHSSVCPIRHPGDGVLIDRALVTWFPGPASYTGEDLLEIGSHGGSLTPQLVLDAVLAAGARMAEPGEFTRRAFLNGKVDLLQAEATLDLIEARSVALQRAAVAQLERGLSRRIESLRQGLIELQALLAYSIDFPEEDDGPVPEERMEAAITSLQSGIEALLRHAPEGELLRDGALTVIAGRPNAGKSSLFNALLGQERAIVTELPGTTRDAIEALLSIEGYPFRLVDTAGYRERPERIESLGIEVAESYLSRAELILFCAEGGRPYTKTEEEFLARWSDRETDASPRVLRLRTKSDLAAAAAAAGEIAVSVETGEGLAELREEMLEAVFQGLRTDEEVPLVTRRRQVRALERARGDVASFDDARRGGLPPEVVVTHLQDAQLALEELIGIVDTEDVLDAVFSSFCIGK